MRYLVCADLHLGAGADLGVAPGDRLRMTIPPAAQADAESRQQAGGVS